jgi:hypothetical protein
MKNSNNNVQKEPQINLGTSYELWDWADKLKVSAERLKLAVNAVGNSVSQVRRYLKR